MNDTGGGTKTVLYWVMFTFILANVVVIIWAFRGSFVKPAEPSPAAGHATP